MHEKAREVPPNYMLAERVFMVAGVLVLILGVVLNGFLGLSHAVFFVCLVVGLMLVGARAAIRGLGLRAQASERAGRGEDQDTYDDR